MAIMLNPILATPPAPEQQASAQLIHAPHAPLSFTPVLLQLGLVSMSGGAMPPAESGKIDLSRRLNEVSRLPIDKEIPPPIVERDAVRNRGAIFRSKAQSFWREQNLRNRSKEAGHELCLNPACADGEDIIVEDGEWESSMEEFGFALVGFVCGMKPNLGRMKGFVRSRWGPEKEVKVAQLREGVFIFRFTTKGKMEEVLEGGPWSYENRPFLLKEWNPDEKFELNRIEKIHTWVRFPELLPNLWRADILSKIASAVGRPIRTDAFTAQGEKLMYARVLLEISAKNTLKRSVNIKCPGGRNFIQIVQYEWTPPCCEFCQVFGHDMKNCEDYSSFMADKDEPGTEEAPLDNVMPDEIIEAETIRLKRMTDRDKLLVGECSHAASEDSANMSHISPTQSPQENSSVIGGQVDLLKRVEQIAKEKLESAELPSAEMGPLANVVTQKNLPNRFEILSDKEAIKELERVEQGKEDNFIVVTKKSTMKKIRREEKQEINGDKSSGSSTSKSVERIIGSRTNGSIGKIPR